MLDYQPFDVVVPNKLYFTACPNETQYGTVVWRPQATGLMDIFHLPRVGEIVNFGH